MKDYDVAIAGGGLLGISVAFHLARAGASVVVVDAAVEGSASPVAVGAVSAASRGRASDEWFRIGMAADDYYPLLISELAEMGFTDSGYQAKPLLITARTRNEVALFTAMHNQAERRLNGDRQIHGLRIVSPAEAHDLVPVLGDVLTGLLHENAALVDGGKLVACLRAASQSLGVDWRQGRVERMVVRDDRAAGLLADGEEITADAVVLATGAWSEQLGQQLGMGICLVPDHAEMIELTVTQESSRDWAQVQDMQQQNYLPWNDRQLLVTSYRSGRNGMNPGPTAAGLSDLLGQTLKVMPGLENAVVTGARSALRPTSQDLLPLMGPSAAIPNAFVVTGHGTSGLHLGPYSGKLMADMILGRSVELDMTDFSPQRFKLNP